MIDNMLCFSKQQRPCQCTHRHNSHQPAMHPCRPFGTRKFHHICQFFTIGHVHNMHYVTSGHAQYASQTPPPTPPSIRGTGTGAWTYRSWVWIKFSHCWKCLINPFWRALNSLTVSAKESLFRSGECCLPIAFSMQNTKNFLGPIGPRIPTHIMHFVDAQYASGTPPPHPPQGSIRGTPSF